MYGSGPCAQFNSAQSYDLNPDKHGQHQKVIIEVRSKDVELDGKIQDILLGVCSITTDNLKIGDGFHDHLQLINGIKTIGKIELKSIFRASQHFVDDENQAHVQSSKSLIYMPVGG